LSHASKGDNMWDNKLFNDRHGRLRIPSHMKTSNPRLGAEMSGLMSPSRLCEESNKTRLVPSTSSCRGACERLGRQTRTAVE
jgi:hypothetical protein